VAVADGERAAAIAAALKRGAYRVTGVAKKHKTERPYPPFITSTLQQQSSIRLRYTAKKTMMLAQQLYEGVELGDKGSVGLITYMRTDSVNLADGAVDECREYIAENFPPEYLPKKPVKYRSRKDAQGAHEAVRPTSAMHTPDAVKPYLTGDQHRLYTLIWERFVACQMAPARHEMTEVEITADVADAAEERLRPMEVEPRAERVPVPEDRLDVGGRTKRRTGAVRLARRDEHRVEVQCFETEISGSLERRFPIPRVRLIRRCQFEQRLRNPVQNPNPSGRVFVRQLRQRLFPQRDRSPERGFVRVEIERLRPPVKRSLSLGEQCINIGIPAVRDGGAEKQDERHGAERSDRDPPRAEHMARIDEARRGRVVRSGVYGQYPCVLSFVDLGFWGNRVPFEHNRSCTRPRPPREWRDSGGWERL